MFKGLGCGGNKGHSKLLNIIFRSNLWQGCHSSTKVSSYVMTTYLKWSHWGCRIQRDRANMHCHSIACTRSFCMGLTQAEGQKLLLLMRNKYYFYANLVKTLLSCKVMPVLYLTQALSMCRLWSLYMAPLALDFQR